MKKLLSILSVVLVLFMVACGEGKYVDYMDTFDGYEPTIGSQTQNESFEDMTMIYSDDTANQIKVLPVDLDPNFIMGVDISSILDVEKSGGKFYNNEGKEQDVFEILKEKGINYIRLRHWNEPYTENGIGYGGGNNDIETNIEIAKRAARVGMRFLLDFHYSDFWADPSKQSMPRAWIDLSEDELEKTVYQYTYDVIKQFEKAGVRPHMVQIGNEINNGFLYPVAPTSRGYGRIAKFLKQGLKAVNDISKDILTAIHLADGASEQVLVYFFDRMVENEVDFDIIGLSYYAYWHGPMEQFKETLETLNNRYEQEIVVMEYAYGFTEKEAEYASHIYSSELESQGGYNTSFQGQASYIRDVHEAISSIDKGIGTFYWEPAWLPVSNAGWASSGAASYLEAQGDDISSLGNVSWANQALFTYSGQASPVLDVFNLMKTSTFSEEIVESYEETLNIVLNLRSGDGLPTHTTGYTSLDRRTMIPITWNQSEVDQMMHDGAGTYVIEGTIASGTQSLPVTIHVNAYENYISNASFEDGGRVSNDVSDFSLVANWSVTSNPLSVVRVESKNPRRVDNSGFNNINIFRATSYTFELFQEIHLEPGMYKLGVWGRSDTTSGIDRPSIELFSKQGTTDLEVSHILWGASWSDWALTSIEFEVLESGVIIIGIRGSGLASSWAHFDDFTLEKIG